MFSPLSSRLRRLPERYGTRNRWRYGKSGLRRFYDSKISTIRLSRSTGQNGLSVDRGRSSPSLGSDQRRRGGGHGRCALVCRLGCSRSALVGRAVNKKFPGSGYYDGVVDSIDASKPATYVIVWEDGMTTKMKDTAVQKILK